MATNNWICFKILMKKFNTVFWLHIPSGGETKAPQYQHHKKWPWHQYWSDISYHKEHHPIILGNKGNIWGKVSWVTFSSRYIFWKGTLHGCTYYWRRIIKNEELHGGSLHHWVVGIMHVTVQTGDNLQYLTMRLRGYMNATTEPAFIAPRHDM